MQALQPVQRSDSSFNILTLGTLQYPPNADGIRWFVNEVFPFVRSQVASALDLVVLAAFGAGFAAGGGAGLNAFRLDRL